MVRRQIQLTLEQDEALRREAVARGLSIAAVIRELVAESIVAERRRQRARVLEVAGRFDSGDPNWARDHDDDLERIWAGE